MNEPGERWSGAKWTGIGTRKQGELGSGISKRNERGRGRGARGSTRANVIQMTHIKFITAQGAAQ